MGTAPQLARELLEAAKSTRPSSEGDAEDLALVRIEYAKVASPAGSMPPPLTGKPPTDSERVLLDKLGERLAFERSGTRLYEALLSKFDAYGSWPGGPARSDLEEIRDDEHEHFTLVQSAIVKMGGDVTAVTPSANLHAVSSKGLPAVLADPRTDLQEGLETILIAELVDNDCWENLSALAAAMGEEELAAAFAAALEQERDHLRRVRRWLRAALIAATGEPLAAVPGDTLTEATGERPARPRKH
jgi:rubrerythrin